MKDVITLPITHSEAFHTFNQFVIRAHKRDALKDYLQQQGIGTDIYYPTPLPLQPSFAYLNHRMGEFPVSDQAAKEVLALPIFPELREDELATVMTEIKKFYSHH